ncbi:VOC family protein [Paenibacillus sp. NPDC057967]|uniref:VOC family protein n=1 Tax=Paenibacillus sp. NPDC057967 TaxID=3346293 RepID=UPI0036D8C692
MKGNCANEQKPKGEYNMSTFAIGHVLIKTNRLKQTASRYEELGFTVTYRVSPEKSHNAFIYFRDGSFLELFNPKPMNVADKLILALLRLLRPINPAMIKRYMHYIASKEGITDYAMDSVPVEQAEANLEGMKQAGARVGNKIKLSKKLPDGIKQTWWIAVFEDDTMPFLMSAYHPPIACLKHELAHRNGVRGIDCLVIDVPDLEAWILKYEPLGPRVNHSQQGKQCELFFEKQHKIILRKSDEYRLAEIHLLTSASLDEDLAIQPHESHGATLVLKQQPSCNFF